MIRRKGDGLAWGLTKWGWFILSCWAVLFSVGPVSEYGPKIESTLFPVTSSVELLDIEEVEGGVTVYYLYEKYRGSCGFEGQLWLRKRADGRSIPIFTKKVNGTKTEQYPSGLFVSAQWFLAATKQQVLNDAELWWTHTCHWPDQWKLKRRVYP